MTILEKIVSLNLIAIGRCGFSDVGPRSNKATKRIEIIMDDMKAGGVGQQPVKDGPLADLIRQQLTEEEWSMLAGEVSQIAINPVPGRLARVFATLPRKIQNADRAVSGGILHGVGPNNMPLVIQDWSLARLARVWVLMHIPAMEETSYQKLIEQLFIYGEMEELVALYAALPVYHYPDAWTQRCAEGVRSNMGFVRQAVLLDNHYPARYLDEGLWNQLVLKAFFTDEYIPQIIGLRERNNEALARTLVDYAYERSAAGREINPILWILVSPFIDERAFELMVKRIGASESLLERQAIAFAFSHSKFGEVQQYVATDTATKELLEVDVASTPWADWGVASAQ